MCVCAKHSDGHVTSFRCRCREFIFRPKGVLQRTLSLSQTMSSPEKGSSVLRRQLPEMGTPCGDAIALRCGTPIFCFAQFLKACPKP